MATNLEYISSLCRCCGCLNQPGLQNIRTRSIKVPMVNGIQYLKLEKWFLAFTNLEKATYKSEYSNICTACESKLLAAYIFRNSCLLAEKTFAATSSSPIVIEDDEEETDPFLCFESDSVEITKEKVDSLGKIKNLDLPKGLKIDEETDSVEITKEKADSLGKIKNLDLPKGLKIEMYVYF
jgi:hypothetical protein